MLLKGESSCLIYFDGMVLVGQCEDCVDERCSHNLQLSSKPKVQALKDLVPNLKLALKPNVQAVEDPLNNMEISFKIQ